MLYVFHLCALGLLLVWLASSALGAGTSEPAQGAGPEQVGERVLKLAWQLRDPDERTRVAAEQALRRAEPDLVREVVEKMQDRRHDLLMQGLAAKMGVRAVPALLKLLEEPALRQDAGRALFQAAGRDAVPYVSGMIRCLKQPETRNPCGMALVKSMSVRSSSHIPSLVRLLGESDTDVRAYAAAAIGQAGPDAAGAVSALAKALQDKQPSVRLAAVVALGKIGARAKAAAPAVKGILVDPDLEVRRSAEEALRRIRGG